MNIAGVGGLHNLIASGDGGMLDFKVTDSSFQKLNLRDANAELTVTIEDTEFFGGAFIEVGAVSFRPRSSTSTSVPTSPCVVPRTGEMELASWKSVIRRCGP